MLVTMISVLVVQIYLILLRTLIVTSLGDNMIGPGLWRVVSVSQCPQEYPVAIAVSRRKVNRTHDGFNVKITTDADIDDTYGVRVDICKQVDGGCKPYQVLADESLPCFVQKYAADNTRDFLAAASVDPPDFPVRQGSYEVNNYVFNYAELPEESIFGEFGATAYVVRGDSEEACVHLDLEFYQIDDDGDR